MSESSSRLAPFLPTSAKQLPALLALAQPLGARDVVCDLGCGDGRVLCHIAASAPSVRCVGVEYDAALVERARARVAELSLGDRVEIVHGDALTYDFSAATVLFLYLLPEGIARLSPRLVDAHARGVRIVCNTFSVRDLAPARVERAGAVSYYLYERAAAPAP